MTKKENKTELHNGLRINIKGTFNMEQGTS